MRIQSAQSYDSNKYRSTLIKKPNCNPNFGLILNEENIIDMLIRFVPKVTQEEKDTLLNINNPQNIITPLINKAAQIEPKSERGTFNFQSRYNPVVISLETSDNGYLTRLKMLNPTRTIENGANILTDMLDFFKETVSSYL